MHSFFSFLSPVTLTGAKKCDETRDRCYEWVDLTNLVFLLGAVFDIQNKQNDQFSGLTRAMNLLL